MVQRTDVVLSDDLYELLEAEAGRTGLPLAELIRRALEQVYRAPAAGAALDGLRASFGGWPARPFDGPGYAAALRAPGRRARVR